MESVHGLLELDALLDAAAGVERRGLGAGDPERGADRLPQVEGGDGHVAQAPDRRQMERGPALADPAAGLDARAQADGAAEEVLDLAVDGSVERVLLVVADVVGDVERRALLDLDGDGGHRVLGPGDDDAPEDAELAQPPLGVRELARIEGDARRELGELRAHEALARPAEPADLHGPDRLRDPFVDVERDVGGPTRPARGGG